MAIHGVALLALSCLGGFVLGDWLGALLGVKANVGGVGFAMLILLYLTGRFERADRFSPPSAAGLVFWSNMYLPVVVAMAAQQNVLGAIRGGPLAFLAGTTGVVACFALVPVIARLGRPPAAGTAGPEGGAGGA
ncbi:MAG: malonate transporter subunit MadL [Verrucomicrobia bacterium]|nr:malonate transporter subunit MadL [Verrucomicrobiota bacterium]